MIELLGAVGADIVGVSGGRRVVPGSGVVPGAPPPTELGMALDTETGGGTTPGVVCGLLDAGGSAATLVSGYNLVEAGGIIEVSDERTLDAGGGSAAMLEGGTTRVVGMTGVVGTIWLLGTTGLVGITRLIEIGGTIRVMDTMIGLIGMAGFVGVVTLVGVTEVVCAIGVVGRTEVFRNIGLVGENKLLSEIMLVGTIGDVEIFGLVGTKLVEGPAIEVDLDGVADVGGQSRKPPMHTMIYPTPFEEVLEVDVLLEAGGPRTGEFEAGGEKDVALEFVGNGGFRARGEGDVALEFVGNGGSRTGGIGAGGESDVVLEGVVDGRG
jgi:hypothetical protein